MATRVGVVAAVAGAAVVALLSAALALYGQPLDTGTRSRAAFSDRSAAMGLGLRGPVWSSLQERGRGVRLLGAGARARAQVWPGG